MMNGQRKPPRSDGKSDSPVEELAAFHRWGSDLAGRTISGSKGRYSLLERIGRGGMATVYTGINTESGEKVAVKVAGVMDDSQSTFLCRERDALMRLQHRNIVRAIDSGMVHDSAFLVMEYLEGRTLGAMLDKDRRIRLERAIPILVQICDAIDAVHEAGMMHCDVKQGNIFLAKQPDGSEVAKLFDFGLVKTAARIRHKGVMQGTCSHMAPEMMCGDAYDRRIDIYGAGVTMYTMLTGELPFGDDPYEVLRQHSKGDPPMPPSRINPGIPPELEAVVLRALRKDPNSRFQTAKKMREAIENAVQASNLSSS